MIIVVYYLLEMDLEKSQQRMFSIWLAGFNLSAASFNVFLQLVVGKISTPYHSDSDGGYVNILVRVHNISRQIPNVCLKARKIQPSKFRRILLLILMRRDLSRQYLLIPRGN